jgi:hypothetical protein
VTVVLLSIGIAAILAVVLHGISTRRAARRARSGPPARPAGPRHRRPPGVASVYGSTSDRDESASPGFLS